MNTQIVSRLLLLLSNFTIFACAQLVWKEASFQKDISPSQDGTSAVMSQIFYEEKDSWNPMEGTTQKRKYRTLLEIWQGQTKKKVWTVASWVLGEQIYYLPRQRRIVALKGMDDQYGTNKRLLVQWDEEGKEITPSYSDSDRIFLDFSPSDRFLALVTGKSDPSGSVSEVQIEVFENEKMVSSQKISDWLGSPLFALRWIGNKLYVREGSIVWEWENQGNFAKSQKFPSCFSPGSEFGKKTYPSAKITENGWEPGKKVSTVPKMVKKPEEMEDCF